MLCAVEASDGEMVSHLYPHWAAAVGLPLPGAFREGGSPKKQKAHMKLTVLLGGCLIQHAFIQQVFIDPLCARLCGIQQRIRHKVFVLKEFAF